MVRDYDAQLLESVAVRRRLLRDALLFGPQRTRRTFDENLTKVVAGLCVAAVLCAGTVGWSYLRSRLDAQERQKTAQGQAAAPGAETSAPVPAYWLGSSVTFPAAPGPCPGPSPPACTSCRANRGTAGTVTGYYLIARTAEGFSGGVVEFRQGRIGAEFATEDEACRWLYGQLVVADRPVHALDAAAERDAARRGAALARDVRAEIAAGAARPSRSGCRAARRSTPSGRRAGRCCSRSASRSGRAGCRPPRGPRPATTGTGSSSRCR